MAQESKLLGAEARRQPSLAGCRRRVVSGVGRSAERRRWRREERA